MHLNELSKKLPDKLIVRFMIFWTDWTFVVEREKKRRNEWKDCVYFFSRKRQKGEEVESFAFEYLGGLSGLLCTTPTVYSRVQRVVSGSRLCKLGVFFHAPAELLPSSFLYTHF